MKRIQFIILLITFLSCNNVNNDKTSQSLTKSEKELIKTFSKNLVSNINSYQYDTLRNAWHSQIFRGRVRGLTKTERNVFDYYYDKEFSRLIRNDNIELVNKLKYNDGKLYFSKIIYYPEHAEIVLSFNYQSNIDFIKYRVQLLNGVPFLVDYYSYKNELWQSKNVTNMIRLNSRYTAGSTERQQANRCMSESDDYLRKGDTLAALTKLYEIPISHLLGNGLSIQKINLAYNLHDTIFASVLQLEKESNNSNYISYLNAYYFNDTIAMDSVFEQLGKKLGDKNKLLDSLKTFEYFWN